MLASFFNFFDSTGLMPHGMCLLARPDILWTHVAADLFIALAYFSIPVALLTFARRRKNLPMGWVFYMFVAFILWCGITHLISIWTLWSPQYGLEAAAKVVTALVSTVTAIALWSLIPKALKIPSTQDLHAKNVALEREIEDRKAIEKQFQELTASLERRVEERTRALTDSNAQLGREIERRKGSEKQLLSAIFEAEAANRAKTVFLAGMSHELRSPLNSILGFSQLLEGVHGEGLNARQVEYVRSIRSSGGLLLDLIDRLLDLSMAESGRSDIRVEPTDVALCLHKARTILEPLAREAGIILALNPGEFDSMQVLADPTRLTQIFINLGSNAIKYNKPGGKVEIMLGGTSLKDMTVRFIDTGIGIPASYKEQVFQSFNRLNQDKSSVPGAGIGLALSKRLAEAMGAVLTFESTEGAGSIFDLTLRRT
ncbi:MAG: HAMP domain-containing histidine kinase [Rhodospirillaceae bacterium]|nr:HAMP domain-containing histidine kinase [Rhodospirillaceae bacterium]